MGTHFIKSVQVNHEADSTSTACVRVRGLVEG